MPLLKRAYFCGIARSNNINTFFILLWGRESLAITICNCQLHEATTRQWWWSYFYVVLIFLHHIAREQEMAIICISNCKNASTSHGNMQTVNHKKRQWQWAYFSYCAMSKQWKVHFYVILQGANDNTNNSNITRSKELGYDKETQQSKFSDAVDQKWWQQWACSARSKDNGHIFNAVSQKKQQQLYVWCCKKWLVCKRVCNNNKLTMARRENATIK